jgi:hypothetical protein
MRLTSSSLAACLSCQLARSSGVRRQHNGNPGRVGPPCRAWSHRLQTNVSVRGRGWIGVEDSPESTNWRPATTLLEFCFCTRIAFKQEQELILSPPDPQRHSRGAGRVVFLYHGSGAWRSLVQPVQQVSCSPAQWSSNAQLCVMGHTYEHRMVHLRILYFPLPVCHSIALVTWISTHLTTVQISGPNTPGSQKTPSSCV